MPKPGYEWEQAVFNHIEEITNGRVKQNEEWLSEHKLYPYLEEKYGIKYQDILSKRIKPDMTFIKPDEVIIYEAKWQGRTGSTDEKLQTAPYKILQFKKLFSAIGINKVSYTYILNSWFKKPAYKDTLDYVKSIPDCDYIIVQEETILEDAA